MNYFRVVFKEPKKTNFIVSSVISVDSSTNQAPPKIGYML